MAKKLVAYFSASGTTKKTAEMIAEAGDFDLCEIAPKVPYTKADLNWMDKKSRSSVEMADKSIRPEIADSNVDVSAYDEIILAIGIFLVNNQLQPGIVHRGFCTEHHDVRGIKHFTLVEHVIIGSGFGNTVSELQPSAPNAQIVEGKLLNRMSKQEISEWVKSL